MPAVKGVNKPLIGGDSAKVTVALALPMIKRVSQIARLENKSAAWTIRHLLAQALEDHEKNEGRV